MQIFHLKVFFDPKEPPELVLFWQDGQVVREHVCPILAPAVDRWIARGIIMTVEGTDGPRQRVTPVSDQDFLKHLSEDLRGQFSVEVEMMSLSTYYIKD